MSFEAWPPALSPLQSLLSAIIYELHVKPSTYLVYQPPPPPPLSPSSVSSASSSTLAWDLLPFSARCARTTGTACYKWRGPEIFASFSTVARPPIPTPASVYLPSSPGVSRGPKFPTWSRCASVSGRRLRPQVKTRVDGGVHLEDPTEHGAARHCSGTSWADNCL